MCFGSKNSSPPPALPAPQPTVPLRDPGTIDPKVTAGPNEPQPGFNGPARSTADSTGLSIPG